MEEEIKQLNEVLAELNDEYKRVNGMPEFTKSFKEGYEAAVSDLSLMVNERIISIKANA